MGRTFALPIGRVLASLNGWCLAHGGGFYTSFVGSLAILDLG